MESQTRGSRDQIHEIHLEPWSWLSGAPVNPEKRLALKVHVLHQIQYDNVNLQTFLQSQ